ncbi:MAG TPA: nucleotidyltransferase domain-containing protein [Limnochordales bacterium]
MLYCRRVTGAMHGRESQERRAAPAELGPPAGLSQAEWEGYLRGWRRRLAEEAAASQRRMAQARSSLPSLVQTLRRHGATEVYLFGSLCTGTFHQGSDIDLGVRGIPPDRFYAALAALDAACDIPVDVVDLDEASPPLREHILQKGERLL